MNDIIDKTDDIISTIINSDKYKKYLLLREKVTNDKDIMFLIDEIKTLQKKIVKLKIKGLDYSREDKKISEDLNILNNYPIYIEFNYIQEDLNNLFQQIKETIEYHINDITN